MWERGQGVVGEGAGGCGRGGRGLWWRWERVVVEVGWTAILFTLIWQKLYFD